MVVSNPLRGKYINLRSVIEDDAQFIVDIRNDDTKNKYVHAVSNDVNLQIEWIREQIKRPGDYYFVIENKNGEPIGLASIYDVGVYDCAAEFGRWISWGNAAENLESVILSFDFAFEQLKVDYVYMRTMVDNNKVKNFWKRFGATQHGEIFEMDLWLDKTTVSKKDYDGAIREKNIKLLKY